MLDYFINAILMPHWIPAFICVAMLCYIKLREVFTK